MKKFIALMMAAAMLLTGLAAANAATLEPQHDLVSEQPDEDYGEEMTVTFDVEKDIDENGNVTLTEKKLDEYRRADIEALKAGDTIRSFGEEVTVETVEKQDDDHYVINGGFENDGVTLTVSEEDSDVFYSTFYDDDLSYSDGETMTLPMADEVRVLTYRMEADGSYNGQMDEKTMAANEVKQYLLDNSLENKEDGISLEGRHTVYVKDGKITEIHIDWTPNA